MRELIVKPGRYIPVGRLGENEATKVLFPVGEWIESFGDGVFSLLVQRNGDDNPYAAVVDVEEIDGGSYVAWLVTDTDVARTGRGKCELIYTVGGVVAKSEIYATITGEALSSAGDPPEPWENWIAEVLAAGAAAEQSAISAAASATGASSSAEQAAIAASHYPYIGENGNWWSWSVEAEQYVDTGVPASGGGSGDMTEAVYDANGAVKNAGGIAAYVSGAISSKQDTISDLDTIRSGAALGATALQSVPNTYRTAAEQDEIDDELDEAISEKYTKPSGGIPESDLADGVISRYTVTAASGSTAALALNDTTILPGAPTAVSVTLPTPVSGKDYLVGLIFKAGASMTFSDTAPTGYAIKWDSNPTWTEGKVYEIIYRCLWVTDGNGDVIVSAKWSEV